jgi:hypothetical protein
MKRLYSDKSPKKGDKKIKTEVEEVTRKEEDEEEDFLKFDVPKKNESRTCAEVRGMSCPWMTKKTSEIRDPLLRFHNEVVEFYSYIVAKPVERLARQEAFSR